MNENKQKFKIEKIPEDMGKLIYEFDDSDTMYDTSRDKRKAMIKSPAAIILMLILAFMVGWFAYSFTSMTLKIGFLYALLAHLSGMFVLLVTGTIAVLSAFGLWGKFARFAFRHNLARGNDAAERRQLARLKEEMEEKDVRRIVRNALHIYEDYIVIVNSGEVKAYDRSRLKSVRIRPFGPGKKIEFESVLCEKAYAHVVLTSEAARECRRIFKDEYVEPFKVLSENVKKHGVKVRRRRSKPVCTLKMSGPVVGATLLMLVVMGAGAAVIALHYCVADGIPVFLGVFFIMGGVVGLFCVYESVPIIKAFFIPFAFGATLSVAPLGLLGAIFDDTGTVFSFESVFGFFSPLNAGFVFLTLMGVLIFLYSFYALYKYIRYGE